MSSLDKAMLLAKETLPAGYSIRLTVKRGFFIVLMKDPSGQVTRAEDQGLLVPGQIEELIQTAIKVEASGGGKMSEADYKSRLQELVNQYWASKKDLAEEYALSRSNVKIGDIVRNCNGRIMVEKITVLISLGVPICKYFGTRYTGKNKPYKNGDTGTVYQSNLIEIKGS